MIAIYLAPIYILLNLYIFRWLLRWMKACTHHFHKKWVQACVLTIYSFFALSLLFSFFWPVRWLKILTNMWFGTICYILLVTIAADLIRLVLKYILGIPTARLSARKVFVTSGTICIVIILGVSIYGVIHGKQIKTTAYQVKIDKQCDASDSLRIVLASDLHLGYNTGNREMQQMVRKINAQKPDLVVIAGDFFDNDFEAIKNPDAITRTLRGIQSNYGVFACYGNHDVQEKILAGFTFPQKGKKVSDPRMDAFLKDANIRLLRDEGVLLADSFYLYGRADEERPGRGIKIRKTPAEITQDMDHRKPIIVIDHEPKELPELSQSGVDLDLGGHTHDGQMFPGNLAIKPLWENPCGYLKKGQMHSIVSSGVGVFGPNMRVGTRSEICSITVAFNRSK